MNLKPKITCAALAAIAALVVPLVLSSGCNGKKKKAGPKPVVIDPMEKWSSIRGRGEEGKQLCEQGMKSYQTANTDEERKSAQEMMSRGIDMANQACDEGADLLEAAKSKHPGHDFGGYEDEMSRWGQAMFQARKFSSLR